MKTLVRKKQLASDFAVSPRTVDAWVSKGVIPFIKVSPRLNLFDPVAVRAALEGRFGIKAREVR